MGWTCFESLASSPDGDGVCNHGLPAEEVRCARGENAGNDGISLVIRTSGRMGNVFRHEDAGLSCLVDGSCTEPMGKVAYRGTACLEMRNALKLEGIDSARRAK